MQLEKSENGGTDPVNDLVSDPANDLVNRTQGIIPTLLTASVTMSVTER